MRFSEPLEKLFVVTPAGMETVFFQISRVNINRVSAIAQTVPS
jgi:hypothetical protein